MSKWDELELKRKARLLLGIPDGISDAGRSCWHGEKDACSAALYGGKIRSERLTD